MSIQDGVLAAILLGFCWAIVSGVLRIGHWWLDWCDRREDAKFRAELLLAEARLAASEGCAYCGPSLDPTELCTKCANELRGLEDFL